MDLGLKSDSIRRRDSGFTIVELIVTMTVIAIVLSIAGFGLKAFMRSTSVTTSANQLLGSFMLAKSEAVKRGGRIVVCRSVDGATCDTANGRDGIWDNGWLVFFDDNENNLFDPAPTATPPVLDEMIRIYPALSGDLKLRSNVNLYDYIAYESSGIGSGAGLGNGTFALCYLTNGAWEAGNGWEVIISALGRARATRGIGTKCDLNNP